MTIQDLKDKGLLLLECLSGSRAYGLATERSDTDIRGVFYLPKDQFYGLQYIPQVGNETSDEVYYELGRFVELLIRNNPNILELLATPETCIRYRHPLMERLHVDRFLSKLCKETFGGYALTQVRKARGVNKKIVNPVAPGRKSVLHFCYVLQGHQSVPLQPWLAERGWRQEGCGLAAITHTKGIYALFYDASGEKGYSGVIRSEAANEVALSSIPKGEPAAGYLFFNLESYSSYCKEYKEYQEWLGKRNEDRYRSNQAHGGAYDAKNMMHTIRLLQVAEEIGREGVLRVQRPNREELLAIKAGALTYDELLAMADTLMAQIESAYQHSSLPDAPDKAAAEALLVDLRQELYG